MLLCSAEIRGHPPCTFTLTDTLHIFNGNTDTRLHSHIYFLRKPSEAFNTRKRLMAGAEGLRSEQNLGQMCSMTGVKSFFGLGGVAAGVLVLPQHLSVL